MKKKFEDIYKITEAQHDFISEMQERGCPQFKGITRDEASAYISEHIELYNLFCENESVYYND